MMNTRKTWLITGASKGLGLTLAKKLLAQGYNVAATSRSVDALKEALGTKDVACIIDAKHLCVNCRGIKDTASSTITAELSGIFRTNPITRQEFLHYVGSHAKLDY